MKFSVNWLAEFVDLPKNAEAIADLLTRAGVETENIETHGAKIAKVIVSQVTASSRHPNADRLTVCEVDDGSGTKRQIVCGATNYKSATSSAHRAQNCRMGGDSKSKLRGIESEESFRSQSGSRLGSDRSLF
jgi:phenylalanyl-tRNA synthetase beta chain